MHCYRCGARLGDGERHLRRTVPTGSWVSKRFPTGSVQATRQRFGRRVVCRRCARLIDLTERRLEAVENAKLAAALALLSSVGLYYVLSR